MTDQSSKRGAGYVQSAVESAKHDVRDMADKATEQMKVAAESAQELAEKAREYGEKAQEAVKEFKPALEKSLKDQPMATLAGAVIIGFLLGALWKK